MLNSPRMTVVDRLGGALLAVPTLALCLGLTFLTKSIAQQISAGEIASRWFPLLLFSCAVVGLAAAAATTIGLLRRIVTGNGSMRLLPWPLGVAAFAIPALTGTAIAIRAVISVGEIDVFSISLFGSALFATFLAFLVFANRANVAPPPEYIVYDKAKYHLPDRVIPAHFNVYVYGGMYLGWIVERRLHAPNFFAADHASDLEAFHMRKLSGAELYARTGEALTDELLSPEGQIFTRHYFFDRYESDYDELLSHGLPAPEMVPDSWENFATLKARLDDRFAQWKSGL